jgi:hypothetical protein
MEMQTMMAHCDTEGKTPLHALCTAELDPPRKNKSYLRGLLAKDTTSTIEIIKVVVKTLPESCGGGDLDARTPLHFLCSNPSIHSALLLKIMKMKEFQGAATVCDAVGRVPLHLLTLNPVLARVKPRHVVSMLRCRCLFLVVCMSVAACNITVRM